MPALATEPVGTVHEPSTARIVEAAIKKCGQIAMLPAVAVQIIRLTQDPNSTMEDLSKVIANDPALGVRIIRLVNSAYYGMPGQVSSITRAIFLLGLKAVKNIAIAASLVKLFRGGQIGKDFDASALWTHSIAVATGARMLAKQSHLVSPDEAFLAGLIHDIGIVVELQACDREFPLMLPKLSADLSLSFRAVEAEVLGATHEDFGSGMCRAWNFPESLQLVTGYHHRPWELPAAVCLLPAVVHTADVLAARLGLGYTRTVETNSINPQILSDLNLTEADLDALSEGLPSAVQESQQLLSDA